MTEQPVKDLTPLIQSGFVNEMRACAEALMRLHGMSQQVAVQQVTAGCIGALLDFYVCASTPFGVSAAAAQDRVAAALADTISDHRARSKPHAVN